MSLTHRYGQRLWARHWGALLHTKFKDGFRTSDDYAYHLSELGVQQAFEQFESYTHTIGQSVITEVLWRTMCGLGRGGCVASVSDYFAIAACAKGTSVIVPFISLLRD